MRMNRVLVKSSHSYLLLSWMFSAKAKQAIKSHNEHRAFLYAWKAFHCADRSIRIERRMLRSIRPIVRTLDSNGSFLYYRLVRGAVTPLKETK